ncbi:FecCD family ABC transporter permease [Corynebacterium sp. 335C]
MTPTPSAVIRGTARWTVLLALVVIVGVAGIGFGAVPIAPGETFASVMSQLGFSGFQPDPKTMQIVMELRLPRVVLALAAGAGLAVCGLATQAILRNPLGDPYLLGLSSGASAGAAAVLVSGVGAGLLGSLGVTGGAFVGAVASMVVVVALAGTKGGVDPARIIFAGMAANYFFSAITSIGILTAQNMAATKSVTFWMLGSLNETSWQSIFTVVVTVVLGTVLLWSLGRHIDALQLGDDPARSLGTDPMRYRVIVLGVVALQVAVIVSFTGAIGFLGLVVPHLAKKLTGGIFRAALPTTALTGGITLMAADLLARVIIAPLRNRRRRGHRAARHPHPHVHPQAPEFGGKAATSCPSPTAPAPASSRRARSSASPRPSSSPAPTIRPTPAPTPRGSGSPSTTTARSRTRTAAANTRSTSTPRR